MPELLIITGACGVGKSTISTAWAKEKQGALVEVDYFFEWLHNDDFRRFTDAEDDLAFRLASASALEYLKTGFPVAINFVWTPTSFQKFKATFSDSPWVEELKFVWLKCDLPENHRRDQLRAPQDWMKERVDLVNQEQRGYDWPAFVQVLDSTHLSVEETLQNVLEGKSD